MNESTTEISNTIANNINRLLAYYKMTRSELAKRLDVSSAAVGYWCIGKKIPRMDKIDMMCEIFNVSRHEILDDRQPLIIEGVSIPDDEQKLMNMFSQMNTQGKLKLLERAEELIKIGYTEEKEP